MDMWDDKSCIVISVFILEAVVVIMLACPPKINKGKVHEQVSFTSDSLKIRVRHLDFAPNCFAKFTKSLNAKFATLFHTGRHDITLL